MIAVCLYHDGEALFLSELLCLEARGDSLHSHHPGILAVTHGFGESRAPAHFIEPMISISTDFM